MPSSLLPFGLFGAQSHKLPVDCADTALRVICALTVTRSATSGESVYVCDIERRYTVVPVE